MKRKLTIDDVKAAVLDGAIQDAIATANILGHSLGEGRVSLNDLRAVQQRREWPAHPHATCAALYASAFP
jgi:hypothetical protein